MTEFDKKIIQRNIVKKLKEKKNKEIKTLTSKINFTKKQ